MFQTLRSPDACLRRLLADGPRNSREVLAVMVGQQFTLKQIRRARERQGILIERAGNGRAMHSTWRLPDGTEGGVDPIPSDAGHLAGATRPVSGTRAAADTHRGPIRHRHAQALSEGEWRRRHARVDAFLARGLDCLTAERVADALAERDSHGLRAAGSCAECQNLELRQCPATPRPVIEVHQCWYRRQCTP